MQYLPKNLIRHKNYQKIKCTLQIIDQTFRQLISMIIYKLKRSKHVKNRFGYIRLAKEIAKQLNRAIFLMRKTSNRIEIRFRRHIRQFMALKRNQRRFIYALGVLIICILIYALCTLNVHANLDRQYLRSEINRTQSKVGQTESEQIKLLKQLEITEKKLKEKEAKEAELKQQVDDLQNQLASQSSHEVYGGVGSGLSNIGNLYTYGYCTWYVKNIRQDIPNTWGNAWEWLWHAQSDGWSTGNIPKVGAIGVAINYGHVVYIQSVNDNGTVNLSEANYNGWNVISSRTAQASEFNYIY